MQTEMQLTQLLLDSIVGPLLLYFMLARAGYQRAGIAAAFLYAVALPIARTTVWFLPDALTNVLCLAIIAPMVIFRGKAGPILSGLALGIAGWFRGDFVTLLSLLALIAWRDSFRRAALFAGAWLVPVAALSLFLYANYGQVLINRAGTGLLAWEGLGQQANPWGIQGSDEAAQHLLNAQGLTYGTVAADNWLLGEYLRHFAQYPGFVLGQIVHRFARLVSLHNADPGMPIDFGLLVIPMVILGAVGLYRTRNTRLAQVLMALWVSRAIPFSFIRDEPRFALPMLIVYLAGTALCLFPQVVTLADPARVATVQALG